MLQRQTSFREFSRLQSRTSPFKRQLSLRVSDLPSSLERKSNDASDFISGGVGNSKYPFFVKFFFLGKFKKWVEIFQKHYYQFMAGIIMQRTALNYFHCRSFANIIIITIINKCWYLFYRSCDKIGPLWRLVRLVQKPSIFSNNAYYQLFFIYKGQYQKKIDFYFRESKCVFFFSGWNNAFDSPWGRR